MKPELKKTEKGDKMMVKCKDKEIQEFIGQGLQQVSINNIKQYQFNHKLLNVLLKKDSPINSLTLHNGFSLWCSCLEIEEDKVTFLTNVIRKYQNMLQVNSQIDLPFWFELVLYKTKALEYIFGFNLSYLS